MGNILISIAAFVGAPTAFGLGLALLLDGVLR
jgi:hypothetical protein